MDILTNRTYEGIYIIPSPEEIALAATIRRGDVLEWETDDGAGTGWAAGTPSQNWRGEYIVSRFDGEFYIPIRLEIVTSVIRDGVVIWPPEVVYQQMDMFAGVAS
jgi:hypothetical protein